MVKWRDIDASTISRWIEQSRIQEEGHADAFPASSQKSRMHQAIGKTTFECDLEYTFNSA
jgi:hypothetical protein